MDTYMNIKNSLMLLGSGAFLFLFSALTSGIIWLTVVLMIVGIAGIAIGEPTLSATHGWIMTQNATSGNGDGLILLNYDNRLKDSLLQWIVFQASMA